MIKSPLLSLTPVEKDHTNVTQAFKSHASKDWVKPNKYQHFSFEFLSWKSFTFNFLVKKDVNVVEFLALLITGLSL